MVYRASSVLAFASLLCVSISAWSSPRYDVTVLGSFKATALNNKGQIVGTVYSGGRDHGYLWENGQMTSLGSICPGAYSTPYAINDAGQVVGSSAYKDVVDPGLGYYDHAFLWDKTSGMRDLGSLGGTHSWAYDINEAGIVVGRSLTETDVPQAFTWDAINGLTGIGAFDGPGGSEDHINNQNHVIWDASDAEGTFPHGGIWDSLHGWMPIPASSLLWGTWAINDKDQVVGYAYGWDGAITASLYDATTGTFTNLTPLAGSYDINNSGEIVGYVANSADGTIRGGAALWEDGQVWALNDLVQLDGGRRLNYAYAINNNGQILAVSYSPDGYRTTQDIYYLLTPAVPEVSSLTVLASGVGLLLCLRRRKV